MWRVYLLLVVVTVISGLTPVAARLAAAELPPLTIPFFRFGSAGLLLLLTMKLLRLPWMIPRSQWPIFLGLGAICVPLNQTGFLFGIRLANASHAGITYALVPVIVFWISLALRRTHLSGRMILASTLASAGAVVVVLATGEMATGPQVGLSVLSGDGLLLTAAASWSLFAVVSQPLVRTYGAIHTLTAVFLAGALLHVPFVIVDYLYFDLGRFDVSAVTWRAVVGFTYITLITAYTNYLLWYLVVARFDVTRSAVITNSSFLITVLAEAAWFGQRLNGWIAAGSLVLFAGIALATQAPERGRGPEKA